MFAIKQRREAKVFDGVNEILRSAVCVCFKLVCRPHFVKTSLFSIPVTSLTFPGTRSPVQKMPQ